MKDQITIILLIVVIILIIAGLVYFKYFFDKNLSCNLKSDISELNNNVMNCINQVKEEHVRNIQDFKEIYYLNNQPINRIANHYTDSASDCNNREQFSYYMSEDTKNMEHSSSDPKEEFFNNIIKNNGMIYVSNLFDYKNSLIDDKEDSLPNSEIKEDKEEEGDKVGEEDKEEEESRIGEEEDKVEEDRQEEVEEEDRVGEEDREVEEEDREVEEGKEDDGIIKSVYNRLDDIEVNILLSEENNSTSSVLSNTTDKKSIISVKTPYSNNGLDDITYYSLNDLKTMAKKYNISLMTVEDGVRRVCRKVELYDRIKAHIKK